MSDYLFFAALLISYVALGVQFYRAEKSYRHCMELREEVEQLANCGRVEPRTTKQVDG